MRKFSFGPRNGRGFGLDSHDVAVSSAIVAVTLIAAILIVALVDHQDPGGGPAGGGPVAVPSATDIPTPLRTSAPSTQTATTTPSPTAMVTAQPSTPAPPATSTSPAPPPTTTPPAIQPPPLRPAVTIINNSRIEGLAVQVEPLVSAKGFIVQEKGNYSGEVVFSHTTVLYENGQEGFAEELVEAMKGYDDDIKIKLNDGDRIKPNGTLVFVITKNFKI
ncbi:LytR C-terminal domain-containing protein [Parafrankia sp. FMc6]|uniref:LytR C-terminal domain-containing protein n=1 Tax=Parafrankia soli TaxID=2599596 RepID=UPI0034D456BD